MEQKLISQDKLIQILSEASIHASHPLQKIDEENWFKDDDALYSVLGEKIKHGISFEEACKRQSLWSEQISLRYQKHVEEIKNQFIDELAREIGLGKNFIRLALKKKSDFLE